MNVAAEKGMVAVLVGFGPVNALVASRVLWDDQEPNVARPCITLRSLSSRFPGAHLQGRGGVRQSLVEVSARADTSGGASALCDLIVDAFEPYQSDPKLVNVDGGSVLFAAILLQDVSQGPSIQQQSYRKVLTYSVSFYE